MQVSQKFYPRLKITLFFTKYQENRENVSFGVLKWTRKMRIKIVYVFVKARSIGVMRGGARVGPYFFSQLKLSPFPFVNIFFFGGLFWVFNLYQFYTRIKGWYRGLATHYNRCVIIHAWNLLRVKCKKTPKSGCCR